jgi:hypothetical protein
MIMAIDNQSVLDNELLKNFTNSLEKPNIFQCILVYFKLDFYITEIDTLVEYFLSRERNILETLGFRLSFKKRNLVSAQPKLRFEHRNL